MLGGSFSHNLSMGIFILVSRISCCEVSIRHMRAMLYTVILITCYREMKKKVCLQFQVLVKFLITSSKHFSSL